MRTLLWVASGLVLVVGVQLYILTDHTDRYFAWTIQPPLTAAFLGAAYWSSAVLEILAAREHSWARARVGVPAVLLFTCLTLAATVLHFDRFHTGATHPLETRFLTWVWVGVYAVVPVVLIILLIVQSQTPGHDLPAEYPLPFWLRAVISVQAVLAVALGAMLFILPQYTAALWPWTLTPLTARAIGAWLLGLGVAAAQVMLENGWRRARPVFLSSVVFGVLQLIALARYPGNVTWDGAAIWAYLATLVSLCLTGAYGAWAARHSVAAAAHQAQAN
jgi:hypothetical protein